MWNTETMSARKGFAPVLVLVIVALGIVALSTGLYFQLKPKLTIQPQTNPTPTQATSSPQTDEMANWKTYEGKLAKVKFRIPNEWKVEEEIGGTDPN